MSHYLHVHIVCMHADINDMDVHSCHVVYSCTLADITMRSVAMKVPLLLLCLLWSLVEVHSQTAPYVSFMGETLPNHAFANLSLVGSSGSDSVRCYTDLNTCCRSSNGVHRGDWNPPDSEMNLPFSGFGDIYEARGDQRVDLRRRNNADMPSGIYRCFIPTNAVHDDNNTSLRESVYVGLYATGGMYRMYMYKIIWLHVHVYM